MAAMGASIYCGTPFSNTLTSLKQIEHLFYARTCVSSGSTLNPIRLSAKPLPLLVSAAATAAVEADPTTVALTRFKVLPFRIGHGFDHRLEPGYPLLIRGINIPHERGCEAHSDGDALLHCLVDSILGALGLPDIAQIFPDTDPKWKGAPSSVFIKEAGVRKKELLVFGSRAPNFVSGLPDHAQHPGFRA